MVRVQQNRRSTLSRRSSGSSSARVGLPLFGGDRRPEWHDRGLCAQTDPEAFFPEKGGSTREAKRICNGDPDRGIAGCEVRAECLAWALGTDERFGIWGGMSERERRKLKRRANGAPATSVEDAERDDQVAEVAEQ